MYQQSANGKQTLITNCYLYVESAANDGDDTAALMLNINGVAISNGPPFLIFNNGSPVTGRTFCYIGGAGYNIDVPYPDMTAYGLATPFWLTSNGKAEIVDTVYSGTPGGTRTYNCYAALFGIKNVTQPTVPA